MANDNIMKPYLESSRYIDCDHPEVVAKASELSKGHLNAVETARACFEYVRDKILHSKDFAMNPVTCRASDVLMHQTGFCYAKSHLLAALLRANGIPAGLCYQRLTISDDKPPFCLHGLVAAFLPEFGWYRIDPRGNKKGVSAQFCPPVEKLAFPILVQGEADLPEIWPEPLSAVVKVLEGHGCYEDVAQHLPDMEIISGRWERLP